MNRNLQLQTLHISLVFLTLGVTAASGQYVEWNVDAGNYNAGANWDLGVVPDEVFSEQASINNGGLAFVDDAPTSPFGLSIGRTAGNSGNVEIRSGGNLAVVAFEGSGGQTFVGQAGEGHLTILPGGSLTTESISSAGAAASSLTLGGTGAGTASLTVGGQANLQRNTSILGPNVGFSAGALTFGANHRLNVTITPAGLAPIDVSGTAMLNGTLNVNFNGVSPAVGDSWDLLDAANVSGSFRAFESSASLPAGVALLVSQQPGGANGTLGKIALEAQLLLSVDRGTGAVTIENRATGVDLDIDGYGILSPEGALNAPAWTSLQSQGNAIWRESQTSLTHVAETALTGSQVVPGETTLSLGNLYSFTPSELGLPYPALQFEYHLAQTNEVRVGRVEMVGAQNDIVLVVDPDTGETAIQNQSPFDLAIDAYGILSASNALNPEGWTSLQEGGDADWRESNPASNHLAETNLSSAMALNGRGNPISIGSPFNTDSSLQDLVFEYRLSTGEVRLGTVHYGDAVEFGSVMFDCNGDGVANILDANCTDADQLNAFLEATGYLPGDADGDRLVAFADFVILADHFGEPGEYTDGDFDKNGSVAFADFVILADNFGMSSGGVAAVPEPSGLVLVSLAGFVVLVGRRRRQPLGPLPAMYNFRKPMWWSRPAAAPGSACLATEPSVRRGDGTTPR